MGFRSYRWAPVLLAMGFFAAPAAAGAAASGATAAADATAAAETPAPAELRLRLRPEYAAGDDAVSALAVRIELDVAAMPADAVLFTMPTLIVSTPTAALPAEAFRVTDDRGVVPLRMLERDPTPTSHDREYRLSRAVEGGLSIEYRVPPRRVDGTTRNGPLFDLRRQGKGLMGAGVYFLPVVAGDAPYRIRLEWDLADAPAGTRGIWSLGEGTRETVGPASMLPFSYYAVGPVRSVPEDADAAFAVYWLEALPFEVGPLAEQTRTIYEGMAEFFGERGSPYRVFIRRNPYPAGGGTALARSFMFGVGTGGQSVEGGLQSLLAHEIAHTWPRLDIGEHGETSWYSEGAAEYYSLRLARRMGLLDDDGYVDALNQRLEKYFSNPYVALSNGEAAEKYWVDGRAQRIPYGRGLLYLLQVDAWLKAAGASGLDAAVLEVLQRQRDGEKIGNEAWVALLARTLGERARRDFDAMRDGGRIELPEEALAPCYRWASVEVRPFELGYDDMNLGKVTGLVAGSNAAAAGLREGDVVLEFTPLEALRKDPRRDMRMTVERAGERLRFEYAPRAADAVQTLRFARSGSAGADCGF